MDNSSKISRRRLLMLAAGAIGVSILACGRVTSLTIQPTAVNFGASSCREESTMDKILVVYASQCGSTAEIAKAIGTQLCQRGKQVDVHHVEDVVDLSAYDAVVVGSAVRIGRWLPAAIQFVQAHEEELRQVPTACFTVHLEGLGDSEEAQSQRAAYVEAVRPLLHAQDEAFFAGKMDYSKLGWLDRLVVRMRGAAEVDLRDWQKVRTWADQLFEGSSEARATSALATSKI